MPVNISGNATAPNSNLSSRKRKADGNCVNSNHIQREKARLRRRQKLLEETPLQRTNRLAKMRKYMQNKRSAETS